MKISLLGACQISWQGQPLNLSRRQQRALLYRLAWRLAPVSRDQLAFLFWPDLPDAAARRQLTRLLSALRVGLPRPDLLLLNEETIALNAALIESDSHQLWQAGQTVDVAALAGAVAGYRGLFMTGFHLPGAPEYAAWQTEAAQQLELQFLEALDKLASHYAASDLPKAIQFARQYLQTDPLAELMHRRLISLYRASGDQAAAQRQLEHCTRILEQELGISPLPETRAALTLAAPIRPVPTLPLRPALALPFTGRSEALGQLRASCQRLAAGGLVLITGASGMGKSRLLQEFLAEHPARALTGSSPASGQTLPYHPLIAALRPTLVETGRWQTIPAPWRSELLPLLPDLRVHFPDLPAPLATDPALAQQRLFAALLQAVRALAGEATLLLCLDDLHWADAATLAWLQFLAQAADAPPLLILAAATEISPALSQIRHAFTRRGRLAEVHLDGLSREAVTALASHLVAVPGPDLAARIQAVTAGNPFFVLEILRVLAEQAQLDTPAAALPLPATVREVIESRLIALTPVARQILETAAILSPQLELPLLQETAARTAAEITDALDELLAGQMLALPTASGPPALAHALLQRVILQGLSPWRYTLLQRRAGMALLRYRPEQAAAIAQHFAQAGDLALARRHWRRAADQAQTTHAYETALALLDQAIASLSPPPEAAAERLALWQQRLALRRILVQLPEWEAEAAALLTMAGANTAATLAALEAQISLQVLQSRFETAVTTAGQALTLARQSGDTPAEARIRLALGYHLADVLGRSREGLTELAAACRLAQAAGDRRVLYQALCHLAFVQRAEGQCAAARVSASQALALTPYRPDQPPHPAAADALRELGEANAYLGRWQLARTQLRPLLLLYQTLNDPWAYGAVLFNFGLYSSNMGQHEEAVAALRQLVALSESVGLPASSDYGIWHRAGLARVLLASGQVEAAAELLGSLDTTSLSPGRPYLAWTKAAAEYQLCCERPAPALATLRPAVAWWRQHTSLHDADILLLLAEATADAGEAGAALAQATRLLAPTDMHRYHPRLYYTLYQATGNPEALVAARAALAAQAAHFDDSVLLEAFLQRVTLHRAIVSG